MHFRSAAVGYIFDICPSSQPHIGARAESSGGRAIPGRTPHFLRGIYVQNIKLIPRAPPPLRGFMALSLRAATSPCAGPSGLSASLLSSRGSSRGGSLGLLLLSRRSEGPSSGRRRAPVAIIPRAVFSELRPTSAADRGLRWSSGHLSAESLELPAGLQDVNPLTQVRLSENDCLEVRRGRKAGFVAAGGRGSRPDSSAGRVGGTKQSPPFLPSNARSPQVVGGGKLSGHVRISGAKNSALPLLAGCLLCPEPLVRGTGGPNG